MFSNRRKLEWYVRLSPAIREVRNAFLSFITFQIFLRPDEASPSYFNATRVIRNE
jgi:hypothetical protein